MDSKKVDMTWPRAQEARKYLMDHRITELLNNMTAQLIYHRPDEPKTFLVQFLEELDAGRGGTFDLPALFDESNIESIFGMLDPTKALGSSL
ncbi:hypothetical protein NP493_222g04000 [Ridgeia piscesae]|uniref:Uncharacterized protein n=1 Tax=Ridgeia piscesae TaxID=27915 RepID=A0AAD9UDX7_RIDPI|nr:hypothetical protein NP493_222g04000 [Ridgeia piscesae]